MNSQDLIIGLLATRLMQQNETIQNMDAMLRELIDRVDSVGDRLWRMERRNATGPADQAGTSKQTAQKEPSDKRATCCSHTPE